MNIKTSRNAISSLKGSAFRRASCDGKSWWVRHIATMQRPAGAQRPLAEGAGPPW